MPTPDVIQLHPGFPLTEQDYQPLLQALAASLSGSAVAVAHSHGALAALSATPSGRPLVLLAPSDPGRPRPARRATARLLQALARIPGADDGMADLLRRRSFAAMRVTPPAGPALPLSEAAGRLMGAVDVPLGPRRHTWVLSSAADRRHQEQLALAHLLGAEVVLVEGGHLFPITDPQATAAVIASCLGAEPTPT